MICTSGGISLRQVAEDDMPFLARLYADPSRSHLWMPHRRVYDEREFREAWNTWVSGTAGAKFVVESVGRPVGLVLTYDLYLEHGHAKVGTLLREDCVGHGGGVVATALLMDYLFRTLPLRKIYLESYGYNPRVVGILRKLRMVEEGVLKGDRYWDGSYWDLHVFATYREAWPGIRARVLRAERPGVQTVAGPNGNGKEVDEADTRIAAGCSSGTD